MFRRLAPAITVRRLAQDGDAIAADQVLWGLSGSRRALLRGERTALNYLQTLSGTATRARRYADAVAGSGVCILGTRKTISGLLLQQKYAVSCGGANHRVGLYDAIPLKENHIAAAVATARAGSPELEVEVEVVEVKDFVELARIIHKKGQPDRLCLRRRQRCQCAAP